MKRKRNIFDIDLLHAFEILELWKKKHKCEVEKISIDSNLTMKWPFVFQLIFTLLSCKYLVFHFDLFDLYNFTIFTIQIP